MRIGMVLCAVVSLATVAFLWMTRNPPASPFYQPPLSLPAAPGTIIRSEPVTSGIPRDARAWRVLYVSTSERGEPIAVSGLIMAAANREPHRRPVLAWAHGTTGIVPACAPSLAVEPLRGIPDMSAPLREGWIVTLTDYPGLGTSGPHPYLVGGSEGRAVLDSVRAAHQLDLGVDVDTRYAIWGHSQGGHAALFAGQLAPTYVPEYELVGVAALSPATMLRANFEAIEGTQVGNVLTIFAVHAWSRYYDDVGTDILTGAARRPVDRIANACLTQPSRYRMLVAGFRLPDRIVEIDLTENRTWMALFDHNTPDPGGIAAPVFVGQGLADELIAPVVTRTWVERRCAAGREAEWHTYPDVDHPSVVGPGGRDAFAWTRDRFGGHELRQPCHSLDE